MITALKYIKLSGISNQLKEPYHKKNNLLRIIDHEFHFSLDTSIHPTYHSSVLFVKKPGKRGGIQCEYTV